MTSTNTLQSSLIDDLAHRALAGIWFMVQRYNVVVGVCSVHKVCKRMIVIQCLRSCPCVYTSRDTVYIGQCVLCSMVRLLGINECTAYPHTYSHTLRTTCVHVQLACGDSCMHQFSRMPSLFIAKNELEMNPLRRRVSRTNSSNTYTRSCCWLLDCRRWSTQCLGNQNFVFGKCALCINICWNCCTFRRFNNGCCPICWLLFGRIHISNLTENCSNAGVGITAGPSTKNQKISIATHRVLGGFRRTPTEPMHRHLSSSV